MKLKIWLTLFVLVLTTAIMAMASSKATQYPIQEIVGVSFDVNKNLEMIVNVVYPNGCLHPKSTYGVLHKEHAGIELYHTVQIFEGLCTQAFVQKFPILEMSKPENGAYKVLDSISQRYLGELVVDDDNVRFLVP